MRLKLLKNLFFQESFFSPKCDEVTKKAQHNKRYRVWFILYGWMKIPKKDDLKYEYVNPLRVFNVAYNNSMLI